MTGMFWFPRGNELTGFRYAASNLEPDEFVRETEIRYPPCPLPSGIYGASVRNYFRPVERAPPHQLATSFMLGLSTPQSE